MVVKVDGADFRHLAKENKIVLEGRLWKVGGTIVDPAGSVRVHVCRRRDRAVGLVPNKISWSKQHGW